MEAHAGAGETVLADLREAIAIFRRIAAPDEEAATAYLAELMG
ncbi:hypothetical protein ABH920_007598 [Catenulispora sp. EB89]